MSLAEAIAAVRAGMAYSTSMPPGDQRPPVNMEPGPEATPTPSLLQQWLQSQQTGGAGAGTWSQPFKGPDGNWYEHNSTTGENRPSSIQPAQTDPLAGLFPYDPQSGLVSAYPNESPVGSSAVESGGSTNVYADRGTGLLYNPKGSLLPEYLQKALGGLLGDGSGGGSGGGITALQAEQLKRQAEQDKWNKVVDYITALQNERQMAEASQRARTNTLLAAGPDLAAGNEYRGGFGPSGGYSIMERLQGGAGLPVATGPSIVPLDLGPMPADPGLVDRLLGPLAGVK